MTDQPTLALIHTVPVAIEIMREPIADLLPEVHTFNMLDESLLQEALRLGYISKGVTRRLCRHVTSAAEAGADAILVTCSSISPTVDAARSLVDAPVFKIDDAMTAKAVELGTRIGVTATAPSTLKPTSELVLRKAKEAGKEVTVESLLCEGAFDALRRGDRKAHDGIVRERVIGLARKVDVVILAQTSMSRLEPELRRAVSTTVLTSPRLCIEQIKKVLTATSASS